MEAEFMEHDEKPLPIDIRLLGALAEKCHAFAKALHYKEMEFVGAQSKKTDANPVAVVEALIHINNQLHQHEAAVGILTYAQQHLDVKLKESWYEKLQRWDDALKAYTAKVAQASSPHLVLEATLGNTFYTSNVVVVIDFLEIHHLSMYSVGRMRCLAALARWEELNNLCKDFWTPAEPAARLEMAPMAASAAWNMGEWDQMAEYVSRLDDGDETKLRGLGNTATSGDGSSSGTFFRAVLLVRRGKYDEAREYVERARKCLGTELAALMHQLCGSGNGSDCPFLSPQVLESYERAYSNMVRVQQLSELEEVIEYWTLPVGNPVAEGRRALIRNMWTERIQGAKRNVEYDPETCPDNVRYHGPPQVILAYLKYQWSLGEDHKRKEAFARLQECHAMRNKMGESMHTWALFNTAVMSHYTMRGFPNVVSQFVVAAVTGYFHSIACAANAKGVDDSLQDILRLLTLWFNHGATAEVQMALQNGFAHVNINTWLVVLPQIIARIHSNNHAVRELIQSLLVRIGQSHPQALMYPLLVACKSISNLRRAAAQEVVDKVRQHSGTTCVKGTNQVAILWHEMWHEGLEEASRLYFGEHNIEGMLKVLEPLHEMLEEGAMRENTTVKERAFIEAYRHELLEAWECCMKYRRTIKEAELTQSVSPELLECRNLELAVPGTYLAGKFYSLFHKNILVLSLHFLTKISTHFSRFRFTSSDNRIIARQLVVITSKQRPRKLTIHGSDGEDYAFLLKGHEDLRQDERVMQVGYLLGLGDRHPSNLMLHRYGSGKILHIDFGDCFEASMNREKFPEKVPFRLTRMLVKAMEVSGIEGNFRSTCENVMQVLRTNKDSVMAMMEAFVHDPLINWRLFNFNEVPQMSMFGNTHTSAVVNAEESVLVESFLNLNEAVNLLGDANEVLNERAVVVMARMSNKLTGRDFSPSSSVSSLSIQHAVDHSSLILGDSREVDHGLSVKLQVQKLIIQATSQENLCQNYGWCPFW
ncbi:hypothetical protein GH714_009143 [Hevea brasiliensis]|uniref:non-specific serine/threonine protein kinase n=1 Tax=Hevea brasiliensis TaxID=3981 RepID=A0A6A6KZ23_HEVBR|nr:hypothetical protein GH714_009143 [Hevea brasiliensis]